MFNVRLDIETSTRIIMINKKKNIYIYQGLPYGCGKQLLDVNMTYGHPPDQEKLPCDDQDANKEGLVYNDIT